MCRVRALCYASRCCASRRALRLAFIHSFMHAFIHSFRSDTHARMARARTVSPGSPHTRVAQPSASKRCFGSSRCLAPPLSAVVSVTGTSAPLSSSSSSVSISSTGRPSLCLFVSLLRDVLEDLSCLPQTQLRRHALDEQIPTLHLSVLGAMHTVFAVKGVVASILPAAADLVGELR